jgi:hypothetical protein
MSLLHVYTEVLKIKKILLAGTKSMLQLSHTFSCLAM